MRNVTEFHNRLCKYIYTLVQYRNNKMASLDRTASNTVCHCVVELRVQLCICVCLVCPQSHTIQE